MTNGCVRRQDSQPPGHAPPHRTKHGTHGLPFETPGQNKLGHIYK